MRYHHFPSHIRHHDCWFGHFVLLCFPSDDIARLGLPGHLGNGNWGTSGDSGLGSCFSVCAGFVDFACSVAHSDFVAVLFPVAVFVCFVALVVSFAAVWIMGSAAGSPAGEDYACSSGLVLGNVGQISGYRYILAAGGEHTVAYAGHWRILGPLVEPTREG